MVWGSGFQPNLRYLLRSFENFATNCCLFERIFGHQGTRVGSLKRISPQVRRFLFLERDGCFPSFTKSFGMTKWGVILMYKD